MRHLSSGYEEHFSGKWRFRLDDRRRLIVQVEVYTMGTGHLAPPPPRSSYVWRDAEVQDLTNPKFPLFARAA